ncbi:DNA repair protein rad9 [Blastomyces dermatitidis ER-3]|uniref:DNA repair protein rad9 n=2 Tax=Blastomyces TaxID=229219 RepID=A0A179V408_BLAGS|nr:DNA repair protein rad9 [Blastomyces gilchristii SLH14081]XP_045278423.1 DNA repair protein rad9 [Blastomyces dermatitidis ER-3]EEQ91998.2 DNA repair protein rad9 [Blastomyces dermatitidis ER-3]OAT14157.1 DNA repair protein rad9 [Blastomyces gilchristii SLH14081]
MTSLSFTLLPDALLQLHDVLICLAKFNENVSIEAEESFLRFSALNLTKSAYASFKFDASTFFSQYMFVGSGRIASGSGRRSAADKLTCQLYIKTLLSVFRARASDFKDRETAVERCEMRLQYSPDETQCRFIIQMICRHGVVKTYKLTYEAAEIQHALFDKSKTENQWGIDSKYLREIIDHFGHTAEQLDISSENNRVVFTSFTTKVADGKEILKQPVHTSVAIDIKDFDHFTVEDKLHVAINVKDFKAIVVHAHSLSARVVARYTRPCRPMQVSYEVGGMTCEFTLMTRGESGETSPGSGNRNRELSARPYPRSTTAHSREPTAIPPPEIPESVPRAHPLQPPSQAAAREETQTSVLPHPPHASVPFESLFVPVDDDQQWDEPKYGDEEEDTLGWDTHMDQDALQASIGGRIQDITPTGASMRQRSAQDQESSVAIPPTQRISQVRGIFD